jgi:hypothetical protein
MPSKVQSFLRTRCQIGELRSSWLLKVTNTPCFICGVTTSLLFEERSPRMETRLDGHDAGGLGMSLSSLRLRGFVRRRFPTYPMAS